MYPQEIYPIADHILDFIELHQSQCQKSCIQAFQEKVETATQEQLKKRNIRQFFYLPDIDVFLEKDPSSCRLKYVWCYYNFQSYFQSITPLIHLLHKMYRPIDAETVKQRNQNWSSRLTISTNPTDPPGMQCSWVYEVRLNPSLSLCRLTDTSVESANLHVVAINFQ